MQRFDLSILPINAQQELADFYEFLLEKHAHSKIKQLEIQDKMDKLRDNHTPAEDFKTFILSIPKTEDVVFERKHDYPRDIIL